MFVLEDVLALSREQKNRFVDDLNKKFKDAEAVLVESIEALTYLV